MADAVITALNRRKGNIQAQVTKLSRVLNDDPSTEDTARMKAQLEQIQKIQDKFEGLKQEYFINTDITEEEFSKIQEALSQMDQDIQNIEVSLKTSINKNTNSFEHQCDSSNKNNVDFDSHYNENSKKHLLKLPKLILPLFFGRIEEFNNFKSQFNSLINDNPELSENEKLMYLKSSLKGEAKSIETADDTFTSLFTALQQRYENKRLIVDCHIKNIINMQALKHESAKDLQNLLDCVKKNIRALKVLELERDNLSNALLLNVILDKLDKESRKLYESTLRDNNVPNFDEFLEFLERRCQILHTINANVSSNTRSFNNDHRKTFLLKSNKTSCIVCLQPHLIYHCEKFKNMQLSQRINFVKLNKLCSNCLSSFHQINYCKSKNSCHVCNSSSHHTLLHKYFMSGSNISNARQPSNHKTDLMTAQNVSTGFPEIQVPPSDSLPQISLFSNENKITVLINTAIIYITDCNGFKRPFRAILDSASQSNFLSTDACNILGLKRLRANIAIQGLNQTLLNIKSEVSADLSNADNTSKWNINLLLVTKVTDFSPSRKLNISNLNIPQDISLADATFNIPGKIDVLLGAQYFFEFLTDDKIHLCDNLYLQGSRFGYLVSGSIKDTVKSNTPCPTYNNCFLSTNLDNLNKTLTSFWEIEEVNNMKLCESDELKYCNDHFEKTHFRKPDGKYVVEMPFKEEFSENSLGKTKKIASKRLDYLWDRLERDPTMKNLYTDFLREYENSNHMKQIRETNDYEEGYYVPHHGILRPSSVSTKLRTVFDASAKGTNGNSLNAFLYKGGVLQDDLFSILIRFRKHIYAFTTDIKQMFRMIELNPDQTKYLKILWKDSKSSPLKIYELLTVTYGTTCAPYLATKTLQQLAIDEKADFPLAAEIVLNDFYMDDCLSGSSNFYEFEKLKAELIKLLQRGGMTLHKWCSSKAKLTENQHFNLDRNSEEITVKTLGMLWNSAEDVFSYKVNINATRHFTKRQVLSQIARIYDPLGILGPLIARAKIFMQQLWLLKLEWNETLPPEISKQWEYFINTLPELERIKVPRCFLHVNVKSVVLNGFADASSTAYGAVIYIQTISNTNHVTSTLLCSKSRVAPTKVLTIPRLELSACLLLARLTKKVLAALKQPVDAVQLWSDSTIALAWIATPANVLKTFVSNRVAEIQNLTKEFQWFHISSEHNPADLVSRGSDVSTLATSELWWHGPEPLYLNNQAIQTAQISNTICEKLYDNELKQKTEITLNLRQDTNFIDNLLNITNNYQKLIRILVFIFRFSYNCKNKADKQTGPISTEEYKRAEIVLIKEIQVKYFSPEISALKEGLPVPQNSKLKFINPFLDETNLIRVGGRLTHAQVNFDKKYPIVLPPGNKLVKLIFIYYHLRDFHVGPQALLNSVRQKYWPLGGRNIARKTVHECVRCFKTKPITAIQLMGDLPPERVMPSSPFSNVGLDLCGSFDIKYKGQRKGTLQKIYVAIFVCMATKAIHLEFVSDLTSEAIIAALKRFFARRGKSSVVFSDNATNFVGASAELKRLRKLVNNEEISSVLASEGICWKFSPPRAPNFGGLWEAGVKSFKYHLKRVVGSARLTLEEFLTVIIQIEGILNSRPLSPLSADADDFQVLTPGHFLIGKPINALPEPNVTDIRDNLLNRWQRSQKMVQIIWKRWQNNYLSHLQERGKWLIKKSNLLPGMMVLLKDTQLPICTWSLGRIIKVFPGSDGNVRVAEIRTPKGTFRRPISKISILPIIDNVTQVN